MENTRPLLRNLTVEIGDTVEITMHPSGRRFDGPATITRAWINPIHGLGLGFIPLGAFVSAIAVGDSTRREVTVQLAATIEVAS
tara:strand:- start:475 stop:726 length:252 start_codon:yes stop_codon:yes gene_type:complete